MTDRIRLVVLAAAACAGLSACHRGSEAPVMNAAALNDDDRGAKAGRFLPPADNVAEGNAAAATDTAKESTP